MQIQLVKIAPMHEKVPFYMWACLSLHTREGVKLKGICILLLFSSWANPDSLEKWPLKWSVCMHVFFSY